MDRVLLHAANEVVAALTGPQKTDGNAIFIIQIVSRLRGGDSLAVRLDFLHGVQQGGQDVSRDFHVALHQLDGTGLRCKRFAFIIQAFDQDFTIVFRIDGSLRHENRIARTPAFILELVGQILAIHFKKLFNLADIQLFDQAIRVDDFHFLDAVRLQGVENHFAARRQTFHGDAVVLP